MDGFLSIYLNDQLAMGVLWRQMARRAYRNNRGTPLGDAPAEVATEIAQDVDAFHTMMRRLGIKANPVKTSLAMGAERLARLKPNGRLARYSPLSRFTELEFLAMGIEGKKLLWSTLRDFADLASHLPDMDFDELIDRAAHQRALLEPFRASAGTEALAPPSSQARHDSG